MDNGQRTRPGKLFESPSRPAIIPRHCGRRGQREMSHSCDEELAMPAEKGEAREFNWRQFLPWRELFRSFAIALDLSKLLLATAAVVLMWFSWWLLSLIFVQDNTYGQWPANAQRGVNPYVVLKDRPGSLFT